MKNKFKIIYDDVLINLEKENIHFSTINKVKGLLTGYKISGNWSSEKLW
jgi:hypothetical protein